MSMNNNEKEQDYKKLVIDAAIGLLKYSADNRRKSRIGDKRKKTPHQQEVLKKVYEITNFPSTETRNELALLLGINQRSVQVWFQNKRQISKKKENKTFEVERKNDGTLVNEYQKFVEEKEEIEDEVFDIPTNVLVEIIEKTKRRKQQDL